MERYCKKIIKNFLTELGYSANVIDTEQEERVNKWLQWYEGKTEDHKYRVYNGSQYNEYDLKRLNMISQGCEDLSDFFFNEKLEITASKSKVQKKIIECLNNNKFLKNANDLMQLVEALGTGAIVPYLDDGIVKMNFLNATNIIILKSDNRDVTDVLFWNTEKVIDGEYLKINCHILGNNGYTIYNRKYFRKFKSHEFEKIELDEGLSKIETLSKVPKFSMLFTPKVNNLDINSPYGISCYANALDAALAVDKDFDTLDNELWLGRKRVYISSSATKFNIDSNGEMTPMFDPRDIAFYVVPGKSEDKEPIKESSFDLRIEQLTQALQFHLNIFSSKIGLGHNFYKVKDGEVYVNTDNVMSSNSDVYRKIKKQENILTYAIDNLCHAIAELLNEKAEFSVSVYYDDSIIEDKEKVRAQGQAEYNSKLISKAQYYRDVYKLKDQEALAFAEQMNKEIKEQTITDGSEFGLDE